MRFYSLATSTSIILSSSNLLKAKKNKPKPISEQLKLQNVHFYPSNSYQDNDESVDHFRGPCYPEMAIDNDKPSDHYDVLEMDPEAHNWPESMYYPLKLEYYGRDGPNTCAGTAQGLKGDSLRVEIKDMVSQVYLVGVWPGQDLGESPLVDQWLKISNMKVCTSSDYTTNCKKCKRFNRCGKSDTDCLGFAYPYISESSLNIITGSPVVFQCNAPGQYIETWMSNVPGKKWGHPTEPYPKMALYEIEAFGYKKQTQQEEDTGKTCQCENGIGAKDENCPSNETNKCSSCNSGYFLTKDNICQENQCQCDNGKGTTGNYCPKNGQKLCDSCDSGHYLISDNSCKAANLQCLEKMFNSIQEETKSNGHKNLIDESFENGAIILKRNIGRPKNDPTMNENIVRFNDLSIRSYTLETPSNMSNDYVAIGWIPEEKSCAGHLYYPGDCNDYNNKDEFYGYNKNSGVSLSSTGRWRYEGKSIVLGKKAFRWNKGRQLVTTKIQRCTEAELANKKKVCLPIFFVEYESSNRIDNLAKLNKLGKKAKKCYKNSICKWLRYDDVVPALSLDGNDQVQVFKIVDAEC